MLVEMGIRRLFKNSWMLGPMDPDDICLPVAANGAIRRLLTEANSLTTLDALFRSLTNR